MNNLKTGIYTDEQIKKMLQNNRKIAYRYELLDRNDKPIGEITASGNIDYDTNASIMRVGTFSIKELNDIDFINERIKPYFRLYTGTEWIEFPLGVFLISSPSRVSDEYSITRQVESYDKSLILKEDKFTSRYMIPKNTYYTNAISTILSDENINNYDIQQSDLSLQTNIEFDIGTDKLTAINTLLKAINYNPLYVDAYGCFRATKYINPDARTIDGYYTIDRDSIVLSGATETLDVFNYPNKIVRYLENAELGCMTATVINDDPASKLSTVSRGRTIVDIAPVNDIPDLATLEAYTHRIADEKKIYQEIKFNTPVMPNHDFMECLYLQNNELGISGKYVEYAWNLDLEIGGVMSHRCRKTVSL